MPFLNIDFRNIFQKLIRHNLEKAVFMILCAALVLSILNSTRNIFNQIGDTSKSIRLGNAKSVSQPPVFVSSDEYAKILELVQKPLGYEKTTRNIFKRSSETAQILEPAISEKTDSDRDGMPNEWEIRFSLDPADPSDAPGDLDKDSYTNLDEYIGGADPSDSNSFPGALKLKVLNIFRRSIQVNFFGYIKLPDKSFQLQINWGRKTAFLKVNQVIRGYKIVEFGQSFEKRFNAQINADEYIDNSYIKIQKGEDPIITLIINRPSFEKELYARIQDIRTGQIYLVHTGSKLKTYKVLDINPAKVIIARNKKIYTLQRSYTNSL